MTAAVNPYQTPTAAVQEYDGGVRAPVKLIGFSGRLGRLRGVVYPAAIAGLFYLAMVVIGIAVAATSVMSQGVAGVVALIGGIVAAIAMSVASVSVLIRRLHDTNQSGWWILLMFVPLVNIGLWLYTVFAPGTSGSNQYGPQPIPNRGRTWAGLILLLALPAVIGIMAAVTIPAYQDYVKRANAAEVRANESAR